MYTQLTELTNFTPHYSSLLRARSTPSLPFLPLPSVSYLRKVLAAAATATTALMGLSAPLCYKVGLSSGGGPFKDGHLLDLEGFHLEAIVVGEAGRVPHSLIIHRQCGMAISGSEEGRERGREEVFLTKGRKITVDGVSRCLIYDGTNWRDRVKLEIEPAWINSSAMTFPSSESTSSCVDYFMYFFILVLVYFV